jgi:hypothetical protein
MADEIQDNEILTIEEDPPDVPPMAPATGC